MFLDFIIHLFPRTVRKEDLRLKVTFCLGGMAFTTFLVLAVSGMLLAFHYVPSPAGAYGSIQSIESDVFCGRYIRGLHRLSSHVFLVLLALHALRVALRGAYRPPREWTWLLGCGLMGLAVFGAWSGTLLPMDQLALWATQTGTELVRSLPFSCSLVSFLAPDGVGQPRTLVRFYMLHTLLVPASIAILSGFHFYRIRKSKGVLPWL
ncbi:MAG TPA: cytochrome b N-terminal domain-containing protein [Candidatus Deferrimicrobiaceae bacterium]|jgi:quinol-cytochrome oxidoreductase complex cytochrome b subunit